jgi:uncharacterized protein
MTEIKNSPLGKFVFRLTGTVGRAELFYTPPAIVSILGAYQGNYPTIGWLLILWMIFVIARPVERIIALRRQWQSEINTQQNSSAVGIIERIDDPNIVRVRLLKRTSWRPGTLHIAALSDGNQQFVLGLFDQVQGAEVMGTGLCVAQVAADELIDAVTNQVYSTHDQEKAAKFIENLSCTKGAELVGFTVENSTIGALRFEVAAVSELAEGDVVFTKVAGREVFYQILDAETAEVTFDKNPRGTHIVKAVQLGCYDPAKDLLSTPGFRRCSTASSRPPSPFPAHPARTRAPRGPISPDRPLRRRCFAGIPSESRRGRARCAPRRRAK